MNARVLFIRGAEKLLLLFSIAALASCGGGGDSTGAPAATTSAPTPAPNPTMVNVPAGFPAAGAYERLFTFEGANSTLRGGLSLIHPSDRSVEYRIEAPAVNVTDSQIIQTGSVDAANSKISNLTPNAVLYIVGGDAKRIPLVANGADPKSGVQAAGVSSLCKFAAQTTQVTPEVADFANPLRSRYFASTKGGDGVCETADDGQAAITFNDAGKPIVSILDVTSATGLGRVLATLRNPTTLVPSALVYGRTMTVSQPTALSFPIGTSALTKVVAVSVNLLVGESGNRLIVVDIAGKTTQLDATITAGTGWESAGYDKDNFYVYRNSAPLANVSTSTWKLVRISKTSPQATLLASGAGNMVSAAMVMNSIYVTLANSSGVRLSKHSKTTPNFFEIIQGTSTTSFSVVLASSQGTHMAIRSNPSTGVLNIDFIDEINNAVVSSYPNSFVFDLIRPDFTQLDNSLSATGFAFAEGFSGASGSLGANLTTFNAVNKSALVMGRFPSAATFGAPRALSGTGGNTGTNFATGSLVAVSGTDYLATPRRYYSFDPRIANSIQYTTVVK
jgi:hypothetical protein